jgi:hypothetical protein
MKAANLSELEDASMPAGKTPDKHFYALYVHMFNAYLSSRY